MNQINKTLEVLSGIEKALMSISVIAFILVMVLNFGSCHNPLLSGENEIFTTNERCAVNIPHEITSYCDIICNNEISENEKSEIIENENPIIDDEFIDNEENENEEEIENNILPDLSNLTNQATVNNIIYRRVRFTLPVDGTTYRVRDIHGITTNTPNRPLIFERWILNFLVTRDGIITVVPETGISTSVSCISNSSTQAEIVHPIMYCNGLFYFTDGKQTIECSATYGKSAGSNPQDRITLTVINVYEGNILGLEVLNTN